jgi:hypothetical protein
MLDLLTTCVSGLQFTDHWHTQTSVLSLLQSLLVVSWQRLLSRQILQFPALRSSCHSRPCRTTSQLTTNWVPQWRPFHTNLLVFSSHADFQMTTDNWTLSLTNNSKPTTNSMLQTVMLITHPQGPHQNNVFIVIVQQYIDRCIEMGVYLSPYCIATVVLVVLFYMCAQQRIYTPKYDDCKENTYVCN